MNIGSELSKGAANFFWIKIKTQPKDSFDTIWSLTVLASVTSFLEAAFFNETKISGQEDVFGKNNHKLNKDNFIKLCKIIIGQYLYTFLQNADNRKFLISIYQDTEALVIRFFEQNIFTNFSFDEKDISLYRNWKESFTTKLYSELMASIAAEDYENPYAELAFEHMSINSYKLFMEYLKKKNGA